MASRARLLRSGVDALVAHDAGASASIFQPYPHVRAGRGGPGPGEFMVLVRPFAGGRRRDEADIHGKPASQVRGLVLLFLGCVRAPDHQVHDSVFAGALRNDQRIGDGRVGCGCGVLVHPDADGVVVHNAAVGGGARQVVERVRAADDDPEVLLQLRPVVVQHRHGDLLLRLAGGEGEVGPAHRREVVPALHAGALEVLIRVAVASRHFVHAAQPLHGLPLDGDRRGLGGGQGDGEDGPGGGGARGLGDRRGVGDGDDDAVLVPDGSDGGGVPELGLGRVHKLDAEGLVGLGHAVLDGLHHDGHGRLPRGDDGPAALLHPSVVMVQSGGRAVLRQPVERDLLLRGPGQGHGELHVHALVRLGVGDGQGGPGVVVPDDAHRRSLVHHGAAPHTAQLDDELLVGLVHRVLEGGDGDQGRAGLAGGDGHPLGRQGGVVPAGLRLHGVAPVSPGPDVEGDVLRGRRTQGHLKVDSASLGDLVLHRGDGKGRAVQDVGRGHRDAVRPGSVPEAISKDLPPFRVGNSGAEKCEAGHRQRQVLNALPDAVDKGGKGDGPLRLTGGDVVTGGAGALEEAGSKILAGIRIVLFCRCAARRAGGGDTPHQQVTRDRVGKGRPVHQSLALGHPGVVQGDGDLEVVVVIDDCPRNGGAARPAVGAALDAAVDGRVELQPHLLVRLLEVVARHRDVHVPFPLSRLERHRAVGDGGVVRARGGEVSPRLVPGHIRVLHLHRQGGVARQHDGEAQGCGRTLVGLQYAGAAKGEDGRVVVVGDGDAGLHNVLAVRQGRLPGLGREEQPVGRGQPDPETFGPLVNAVGGGGDGEGSALLPSRDDDLDDAGRLVVDGALRLGGVGESALPRHLGIGQEPHGFARLEGPLQGHGEFGRFPFRHGDVGDLGIHCAVVVADEPRCGGAAGSHYQVIHRSAGFIIGADSPNPLSAFLSVPQLDNEALFILYQRVLGGLYREGLEGSRVGAAVHLQHGPVDGDVVSARAHGVPGVGGALVRAHPVLHAAAPHPVHLQGEGEGTALLGLGQGPGEGDPGLGPLIDGDGQGEAGVHVAVAVGVGEPPMSGIIGTGVEYV